VWTGPGVGNRLQRHAQTVAHLMHISGNGANLDCSMDKKVPTIKEIAKRLNVSVSTVSRALHNNSRIGLRTKMQVQALAKELNYEPNQVAIFFKQQKTLP
jgi:transcriptional regulator with XRE-family HTH domain